MLKLAYRVGVQKALEEAGLTKEAQPLGAISKGLGSLVTRGTDWWSKLPPHVQQMLMGAGIGGAAGGVTGVGVLPGMALGGAGGLARHGIRGMRAGGALERGLGTPYGAEAAETLGRGLSHTRAKSSLLKHMRARFGGTA